MRRRGLTVLLVDTFLMWGGFFMVIPLISVHYVGGLGWAAGSVGLVLAIRQLTQQGLAFAGGIVADRFGAKAPICAGLILRGLGFGAMARADTLWLLIATATLAALGGALFEAPKSAAIAALTDETNRARFYALNGVVGGLGLTVGPLAGSLLLDVSFAAVAVAAGACFLLTALISQVFFPPVRVATGGAHIFAGLGLALRDRPFITFNLLLMGYWFMWVQLAISLPLVAVRIAETDGAVSWVYALNAGLTILLQYPLLRLAERWMRPLPTLITGMGVMAGGLAGVAIAASVPALLVCVGGFSVGALLASPNLQTVTANLANPAALGSYFGVGALALGIGGSVGNFSGGLLYGLGERLNAPALPWLIFATVGLASALGLISFHQRVSVRQGFPVSDAAASRLP